MKYYGYFSGDAGGPDPRICEGSSESLSVGSHSCGPLNSPSWMGAVAEGLFLILLSILVAVLLSAMSMKRSSRERVETGEEGKESRSLAIDSSNTE